jgi:hypothetical protein
MVTKVNWNRGKWEGNTVNNTSGSIGVDIIEAKTNTSSTIDKASDLYPAGSTSFTKVSQYQVTDIAMSNRIVTFNVNGGGQEINLDVQNVPSSNVSVQKIIENGKVVILRDGQKFDILGNRL